MTVQLVSITTPTNPKLKTAEDLIVYCARVSSPKNQENTSTGAKLLQYCIKNKHWSIFEQASMGVEVTTTRAISAQIIRHKSLNIQEFSLRYAEAQHFDIVEARRQDLKNRQNSIPNMSDEDVAWFDDAQSQVTLLANKLYKEALAKGIAKESARFLLPMNTETKLYITGSIRSFIHYIQVRTDPSTQLEHREVALAIQKIFIEQFPVISEALGWTKSEA